MSTREERLSLYDDEQVLTDYLFWNYRNLLTELEGLGVRAIEVEKMAKGSENDAMTKTILQRWGRESHPDVSLALENGADEFRNRVRIRMLADHEEEIMINRCPKCSRIVATPRARQCLWCGHDWH